MARKKSTSKKGTALVSLDAWKAKLREKKKNKGDTESLNSGSGKWIKAKNKFKLGDEVLGEELSAVILGVKYGNEYYGDHEYDPNSYTPPLCFAMGDNDYELEPHEEAPEPQADTCSECPHSKWSGRTPPACRGSRKLALMDAEEPEADPLYLKITVASLGAWRSYLSDLKKKFDDLPPEGVITVFGFSDEVDNYDNAKMTIEPVEEIDDMDIVTAIQKYEEYAFDEDGNLVDDALCQVPQLTPAERGEDDEDEEEEEEEAPRKRRRRSASAEKEETSRTRRRNSRSREAEESPQKKKAGKKKTSKKKTTTRKRNPRF